MPALTGDEWLQRSPKYIKYSNVYDRLQSFKDWSEALAPQPQDLAEAGFFYLGKGDRVACFWCGGGLRDWLLCDDPWNEHAKYFPCCKYVRMNQNNVKYVQDRIKSSPKTKKDQEERELTACSVPLWKRWRRQELKREECFHDAVDDCKVCFERQANILFVPCGHLACCGICSPAFLSTKCPICRMTVREIYRVYKT